MAISEFLGSLISRNRRSGRRPQRRNFSQSIELCEERALLSAVSGLAFEGSTPAVGDVGNSNPLTSIPQLDSLAGAPVTIYLDFDGHTETGSNWNTAFNNNSIPTPVYDIDSDLTTFSDEELRRIEEIWYRVAEDFAPFNVNVTTIDPGVYNDLETILVSIGGDGAWTGSASGGIAFINAFSNNSSNTAYVFTDNLGNGLTKLTAHNTSHEVGHTLGLQHQSAYDANGNKIAEYNPGDARVGPLMGAAFASLRDTWHDGASTAGPMEFQDDLAVMTRTVNQVFEYRTDDHGNTAGTATPFDSAVASVSTSGVIETNDDIDYFAFDTDSGEISFSAAGLDLTAIFPGGTTNPGTNLDLELTLFDAAGSVVATDSPTNSLGASLTATVTAGTYFIGVSGTGEYGAIGQYDLTGTIIPQSSAPTLIAPTGLQSSPFVQFVWTPTLDAARYELEVTDVGLGTVVFSDDQIRAVVLTPDFQFPEADYSARVRSIDTNGTISNWSNVVSFSVDLPAPTRPVITSPSVDVTSNAFPLFAWTATNAVSYTLEVERLNADSGVWTRVINRTNHEAQSYTHFSPLPEAMYRARVRAFNAIGEMSAWSEYEQFEIDIPTPAQPVIEAPSGSVEDATPRVEWNPVEFTYRYDLWVNDLSRGISQVIRVTDIEDRSFYDILSPLPQGAYRAWVQAVNGSGEKSPWSAPETFVVDVLAPTRTSLTGPVANDEGSVTTPSPTFQWDPADRAVRYELWVNHDTSSTARIVHETNLTGFAFTPEDPLPEGEFRAWVRGFNAASEPGPWSSPYRFTIDVPVPSQPVIVAPVTGPAGTVQDDTPKISWIGDVPGEVYDLWVNDVTDNTSQVIRVTDLDTQSFQVPDDQPLQEHTYTAWVRAGNNVGEYSAWSDPFTFRIDIQNPTTPIILGPAGTVTTSRPTFTWQHTDTNVKYEIFVRDLERRENIVLDVETFDVDGGNRQAAYTSPIDFQTGTYRFWIRAFNSQGTPSSWSTFQAFAIQVKLDGDDGFNPDFDQLSGEVLLTSVEDTTHAHQPNVTRSSPADPGDVRAPEQAAARVVVRESARSEVAAGDRHLEQQSAVEAVMAELADPAAKLALNVSPGEGETPARRA